MKHRARSLIAMPALLAALSLAACGGGSSSSSTAAETAPSNALELVVDGGPSLLAAQNSATSNTLYASVTICTPGSTTACQIIDHVQVDTGSTGLRIANSALDNTAAPAPLVDSASGNELCECMQFADGYSWGSVDRVDVTIGGRTISSVPVQLIGDPAAPAAPADRISGPAEQTVVQLGANGILGIGNFLQDCGAACVTSAPPAAYYTCPGGSCQNASAALSEQLQNPVSMLASDNNGLVI